MSNIHKPTMTDNKKIFSLKKVMFSGKADYVLPEIKEVKQQGGFYSYGKDNQYPKYLWNLFINSALHNAIVLGKVDYITGKELLSESDNEELKAFIDKCNRKGDSLYSIFKKCSLDHEIYGGFTFQVIYEKLGGKIAEIYYVDFSKFRFSTDGEKLKYSKDWTKQRVKVFEYENFNPDSSTGTQIVYYAGELTKELYPIPSYVGTIAAIETDIEIANFHLNNIKNGMFPGLHIDFKNGEPTEEEQGKIEDKINDKWGGSSKTGKILITFSDDQESSPTITPVQQSDLDKMFNVLQESVRDRIVFGHRVTNPILFGVQIPGKLGNSSEYNQAYQIFQNTYTKPVQESILNVFNNVLKVNFTDPDLQVKQIEPLDTVFTDERLIAENMTKEEIRSKLKEWNYIQEVNITSESLKEAA